MTEQFTFPSITKSCRKSKSNLCKAFIFNWLTSFFICYTLLCTSAWTGCNSNGYILSEFYTSCWMAPPWSAVPGCLQQPQLSLSTCCASVEGSAHSPPARLGRNLPWKQFHRKTCISWLKENLPQNNLTHTSGNTSASKITVFTWELAHFSLSIVPYI